MIASRPVSSAGFVLVLLALHFAGSYSLADDAPVEWQSAAGRYLDERAKIWFHFSDAERGEGETKTACVSCHTIAPYALARPALRRLAGADQPTEFEKKILAQTRLRVAHWDELDSPQYALMYDFDEHKSHQSRGTEAVLSAFILACDDRYEQRQTPGEATRQAFANLWRTQEAEGDQRGSWDWLNFNYEPWESPSGRYHGAALAAIALGTAPGYYKAGDDAQIDGHVALLRGYLRERRAGQNAFNRIWLLWASRNVEGLLTREERDEQIAGLLKAQQADGGWRLASLGEFRRKDETAQPVASDGYATGLVLHVLQMLGTSKQDQQVGRGLDWLRANQSASGAWIASSLNKARDPATHSGRLMSDAATAFAVLALSH